MSSRPGRIKEMVSIDLARPRELSVKRSAQLGEYVDHIWNGIRDEARQAASQ
jgi:NitT/TauT family transport system ATP-binding protein